MEEQRSYFESKLAQQQKEIEALIATVQKVSEQPEVSATVARIVAGD